MPLVLEHRLAHRVRVLHGGTGRRYERIEARLADPVWPHWRLRVIGADVVLSADARRLAGEPATTTVVVQVAEAAELERFADGGAATIELARGGDESVTLTLEPVPVVLEVVLVFQNGDPRPGRTVRAQANGDVVELAAVAADSNVYRSAPRAWVAEKPYEIRVNGQLRTTAALDYTRPVTRVRVIDP